MNCKKVHFPYRVVNKEESLLLKLGIGAHLKYWSCQLNFIRIVLGELNSLGKRTSTTILGKRLRQDSFGNKEVLKFNVFTQTDFK